MLHRRRWVAVGLAGIATALPAPSSSLADITASSVTTPADGTTLFYDDLTPTTLSISGTATGSGNVDIVCYRNGFKLPLGGSATNVPVSGGTFSVPNAPLNQVFGTTCRLLAFPTGTTPSDTSPFTGPRVALGGREEFRVASGPNTGKLYDFYIASMSLVGGSDYGSLGSFGLTDSYLIDATPNVTAVFYSNAVIRTLGAPPTRAALTVDGAPAFPPAVVHYGDGTGSYFAGFEGRQPFPGITYSFTRNPTNGDLTITEADRLVKCRPTPKTFKPTPSSCTSFADAGVKLDRTIVADHGQRVTRITDRWSSVDKRSHPIRIQYLNEQALGLLGHGANGNIGYRFPGDPGYTTRANGQTSNGPFPAPGAILVRDTAVADGDPTTGQGAIVWSAAPNNAIFNDMFNAHAQIFDLTYNRTVPASGSLNLGFGYATALTTAKVAALARGLEDAFRVCRLKAKRSRVSAPAIVGAAKAGKKKGVLNLTARCSQSAKLRLVGSIIATVKGAKGKKSKVKSFAISSISASAKANKRVTLSVKVPKAALRLLKKGAKESATFTLTATNLNGASTATAKIARLKLSRK